MSTLRDTLTTHEKFLTGQIASLESERQRVREQLSKLPQKEQTRLMDSYRKHQARIEEQDAIKQVHTPPLPAHELWKAFENETGYSFGLEFRSMGIYFCRLMSQFPQAYLEVPLHGEALRVHAHRIPPQWVRLWSDAIQGADRILEHHLALHVVWSLLKEENTKYRHILHSLTLSPETSKTLGNYFKITYQEDS